MYSYLSTDQYKLRLYTLHSSENGTLSCIISTIHNILLLKMTKDTARTSLQQQHYKAIKDDNSRKNLQLKKNKKIKNDFRKFC